MRRSGLVLALALLGLAGCSEDQSGLTPAERAKKGRGMSEENWKVYSGTESGVADEPDASKGKPAPPPADKPEQPKGTQ